MYIPSPRPRDALAINREGASLTLRGLGQVWATSQTAKVAAELRKSRLPLRCCHGPRTGQVDITLSETIPHASLSRKLVAEGLGTALLLAIVVGSGIMGEQRAPVHCARTPGEHAGNRRGACRAHPSVRSYIGGSLQPVRESMLLVAPASKG